MATIANLTLSSIGFADDANNGYTGTDKIGLFLGGSKTTLTYTATLSADVDQVYFAPELYTPSLYRQALSNYDPTTRTPVNGFFAAIGGDGTYPMSAYGNINYFDQWGDVEAAQVVKSGTTFTFLFVFRANADMIGGSASPFDRLRKFSRLDNSQGYGYLPYAPSAFNQNGISHYVKAWYLAADTSSGDTWEGENNLQAVANEGKRYFTATMEAYNASLAALITSLTESEFTDIPASNAVEFKFSASVQDLPVGSSVVGDLDVQLIGQLFVNTGIQDAPYTALDGSTIVLTGTSPTANRLALTTFDDDGKTVTAGLLDWSAYIVGAATISDLLGTTAFLALQSSVVDNTEGEIYLNVTYLYPIRFTNATTLQESIETDFAANNGQAVNARTYSNMKLSTAYYTLTGTDNAVKYIEAQSDSTLLERFVTFGVVDASAFDALNTYSVNATDWRNGLKALNFTRATKYTGTGGQEIVTFTDWGCGVTWANELITPNFYGDLDKVDFAYNGDKTYVYKYWRPIDFTQGEALVKWTGRAEIDGKAVTRKQFEQLVNAFGVTYNQITDEFLTSSWDFELEGFSDLLRVNMYEESITYITQSTAAPTIKTLNRDGTTTTYADDDFYLEVGIFDDTLETALAVAHDYPNSSSFDKTTLGAASITAVQGDEIYTQDSAIVGLAAAKFTANDTAFLDEVSSTLTYDAANNRFKVNVDAIELNNVYIKNITLK